MQIWTLADNARKPVPLNGCLNDGYGRFLEFTSLWSKNLRLVAVKGLVITTNGSLDENLRRPIEFGSSTVQRPKENNTEKLRSRFNVQFMKFSSKDISYFYVFFYLCEWHLIGKIWINFYRLRICINFYLYQRNIIQMRFSRTSS